MQTQIVIKIDSKLKDTADKVASMEGKSLNDVIEDLLKEYITKRNISTYIDELWNRISRQLRDKGVTEADIDTAIAEVRQEKRQ